MLGHWFHLTQVLHDKDSLMSYMCVAVRLLTL